VILKRVKNQKHVMAILIATTGRTVGHAIGVVTTLPKCVKNVMVKTIVTTGKEN